ncbi:MAG: hypothetical protein A2076_08080 [Geobacteraceae bacterium GWC2_53_11]|nr:MAG: hypothetical protein A2076_08080 [Geobacteraceae bacterium GWC2_53_11]
MELMRRVVTVVCAALLFLPVLMKSRTSQELPDRAAFSVLSSGRISVKISGAVLHEGIYTVPANTMTESVINMAQPVRPFQRLKNERAASPLTDGAAVALIVQPDGTQVAKVASMSVSERIVLGVPLDISIMNEADFDRLPGVGPALSRRIVAYRQNNGGILRVSDLGNIEGIGEKKYRKIKEYFQHP